MHPIEDEFKQKRKKIAIIFGIYEKYYETKKERTYLHERLRTWRKTALCIVQIQKESFWSLKTPPFRSTCSAVLSESDSTFFLSDLFHHLQYELLFRFRHSEQTHRFSHRQIHVLHENLN